MKPEDKHEHPQMTPMNADFPATVLSAEICGICG
jgi:hypothetical protein